MSSETIQHHQEQAPRNFLELGTRSSPVMLVGERRLAANERYIGIDIRLEDVLNAAKAAQSVQPEASERMLFLNADGQHLPLADASIHEALLNNVLGDPKTFERGALLHEMFRVLAERGRLTISEMYSPEVSSEQQTVALCQDAGFVLRRMTMPSDAQWKEVAALYGILGARNPDPDAYVAEFEKIKTS